MKHPLRRLPSTALLGLSASTLLALGLACAGVGTPEDPPGPEATVATPEETPPGFPVGPGIVQLAQGAEACTWRWTGLAAPLDLGETPGDCPQVHTLGTTGGGPPQVGVSEGRVVRILPSATAQVVEAPPDGELVRAGLQEGALVAATLREISGAGPLEYGGQTWRWERSDGIYALAIRWRHDGSAWQREEVATTTTGWDLAQGIDALSTPVAPFEEPGEDLRGVASELEDKGLAKALDAAFGPSQREGWFLATTPHGRLATGWLVGEFIHATGPIALDRDGSWTEVPLEGGRKTTLRTRLSDPWFLAQVHGGEGVVVDLSSGEEAVRGHGALVLSP